MAVIFSRRGILVSAGLTLAINSANGQQFPSRTVRIVVPYPPGGSADALARILANEIQGDLGQTVIVENKAGGAGAIGTRMVAKGEADGHQLLLGTNQTHVNNAFLLKDVQYHPVKDFVPLAGLADLQLVLVVRNDLGVKNVQELIALAKKEPIKLNYGSSGVGSGAHLAMELFASRAGTQMTHIPYSGAAPMAAEIVAERLDVGFVTLPSVLGQLKSGLMTPLAVSSLARAPQLPDVPTLKEQGVENAESDAWLALYAPAATPSAAVKKLSDAVTRAMANPAVIEQVIKLGYAINMRDSAAFVAYQAAEMAKWGAVIKAARIDPQ